MMATTQLTASGHPIEARYIIGWYAGRGARIVVAAAAVLAVMATVSLLALAGSSYRPMVVRGEGIEPAFSTGDVVVSQVVAAADIKVGDIVTYIDGMRGDALVTERVLEVTATDSEYSFTTMGAGSTAIEHLAVDIDGEIGRITYQPRGLGRALDVITSGFAKVAFLASIAILLIRPVVRRGRLELNA